MTPRQPQFADRDAGPRHEFRVFSATAEGIELCLFDEPGSPVESRRAELRRGEEGGWSVTMPGVQAGQLYGYRAAGPWNPEAGLLFNPRKLLLDPCARGVAGVMNWDDAVYPCRPRASGEPALADERDSAPFVPRSVIVDDRFDWGSDQRPHTAWRDTLIYECHVKGTTMRHPEVPAEHRGRYLGLASPVILDHLLRLGVTAVELMPVQHSLTRRWLVEKGLSNYWGYDPIGFFAPDARFASGDRGQQVVEFKQMVRTLHAHGLEVLLDVVFNHTVEGDENGPSLCFRGLDNSTYYRLDEQGRCVNVTGCGNTLNTDHPATRRLILDALRYWVTDMHVDGFRFDLASALARRGESFDSQHPLLAELAEDPVLSGVKMIMEPWDAAAGGYALGRFPPRWPEWNDHFRDRVRRFWRGDAGQLPGIAYSLSGSSDVFAAKGSPLAGVNFVVCHDGFTLRDLTTYEDRRNHANGEDGRDGTAENFSCAWGREGPTDDPRVSRRREQAMRNMLATLALSPGVPMITAGDEFARTQGGNNNAYAQDNDTSWLHWPRLGPLSEQPSDGVELRSEPPKIRPRSELVNPSSNLEARLLSFARELFALRREHPLLRPETFLQGAVLCACGFKDVAWLGPDGSEISQDGWLDPRHEALGVLRHGHASPYTAPAGETLLLLMNAAPHTVWFELPPPGDGHRWRRLLATVAGRPRKPLRGRALRVPPFSLALLSRMPLPASAHR